MRRTSFLLILITLLLAGPASVPGTIHGQGAPAFDVAGTDVKQVSSFLKTLQSAVAIDNRLKVASLFDFPLTVRVGGEELTLKTAADFQARYGRIFDAQLKAAIAAAKVETLFANQQGVMFDNGRVWFRPIVEHKNALKIVAINDPGSK